MSTQVNSDEKFIKVSYKRKGKPKNIIKKQLISDCSFFDLNLNERKIYAAKEEILTTDIFQSVSALLKEGLVHISHPEISKIISFGLGQISESTISRYQLALLLCLKDLLHSEVEVSDPIFNDDDIALLKNLQISVTTTNIEGKYNVGHNTILFYLPHCPKQLMNNLLWSNWGLHLTNCIIIGNSITQVVEDNLKTELYKSALYISKICPYVLELGIVNSFKLFEVFNDMSIHFFPFEKIKLLSVDFWEDQPEPKYSESDVELIRNTIENKLKL